MFATAKPWQNKDIVTLVCLEQTWLQQHGCIALNNGWGHTWFSVTAVQATCVCACTTIQAPVLLL